MSEYEELVKQYMGPARTKRLLKIQKKASVGSLRRTEKSPSPGLPSQASPRLPHVATVQKLSQSISDERLSSQKSSGMLRGKSGVSKARPPNIFEQLRARVDMKLLVPRKKEIEEFLNQEEVKARKIQGLKQ